MPRNLLYIKTLLFLRSPGDRMGPPSEWAAYAQFTYALHIDVPMHMAIIPPEWRILIICRAKVAYFAQTHKWRVLVSVVR